MEDEVRNSTYCKKFESWIREVSVVCKGEVDRVVLFGGQILYYDWELKEESGKRRDESIVHETVNGNGIWPTATGVLIKERNSAILS